MRFIKRLVIATLLIFIDFSAFFYWGTYEKGVMAGKELRISQKGIAQCYFM